MFKIFQIKKNKKDYHKSTSVLINQNKSYYSHHSQKGITLVIAITTMTLLLSISLSISNIVLRQIRMTNINNASKPAFFIADSGAECAFYYDTKFIFNEGDVDEKNINEDLETAVFGNSEDTFKENTIKCGNGDILNIEKNEIAETSSSPKTVITSFDIDYGEMCATVRVTKTEVGTKINSYGYNTPANNLGCDLLDIENRRLVERGLTIEY